MMSPSEHARGKYLHPIASSIVAKRPSPCSGKGVMRAGGAYLKQTAVLPRSGNEIQPPHSCQHSAHVRQGLHGVTDQGFRVQEKAIVEGNNEMARKAVIIKR